MPRKPEAKPAELPAIPPELLEQFGNGPMTAEAINAAMLALKKALIERALGGEMSHHLGYPPGAVKPAAVTNQRDGTGARTILRHKCGDRRDANLVCRILDFLAEQIRVGINLLDDTREAEPR